MALLMGIAGHGFCSREENLYSTLTRHWQKAAYVGSFGLSKEYIQNGT